MAIFFENVISYLLWAYVLRYIEINSICIILTSVIKMTVREKYNIINFISSGYYIYNIISYSYTSNAPRLAKIMNNTKLMILLVILKLIKNSSDEHIINYIHILSLVETMNLLISVSNNITFRIIMDNDNDREAARHLYTIKLINATFNTFINMYQLPMYVIKMNNIIAYQLFVVIAINNFQCFRLWRNVFQQMMLF